MSNDFVRFDDVWERIVGAIRQSGPIPDEIGPVCLVRNLYGTVRISVSEAAEDDAAGRDALQRLAERLHGTLGAHGVPAEEAVLFVSPALLRELQSVARKVPDSNVYLADRLVTAADTESRNPECATALHYDGVKNGVREASKIRVREIREDYPWMDRVLSPLEGLAVPCGFDEIKERWRKAEVLDALNRAVKQDDVKLPPAHIDQGADGVRRDLEALGVFQKLRDGRVNIPDVFRVGYGLGRKGGVKPVL